MKAVLDGRTCDTEKAELLFENRVYDGGVKNRYGYTQRLYRSEDGTCFTVSTAGEASIYHNRPDWMILTEDEARGFVAQEGTDDDYRKAFGQTWKEHLHEEMDAMGISHD